MSPKTLKLTLLDGRAIERINQVTSLVAEDASGQFGVRPGHAAFVTMLEPGLFRWRTASRPAWFFGACTGGLLSCATLQGSTEVRIVSGRFLQGAAAEPLIAQLDGLLRDECGLRLSTRESTLRLEIAFVRRMQELSRTAP
jgi:F-type H+-transporting ATPase subunit epsilon